MRPRLPSRLYAIADPAAADRDVVDLLRQMLAGGARVVQMRWKGAAAGPLLAAAAECRRLCRGYAARLVINDRADLAMASEADGVHLGQNDLPLRAARRLLGPDRWIGVSTHDVAQARRAADEGADYIGFGPIFSTATKETGYPPRGLDALRAARSAVEVPIVAIGGVTPENARSVLEAGADAVAMIAALMAGPDVAHRVRTALAALESGGPLDSGRSPQ
jgi:thiamine-phosphate pyrophosphorylase